VGDEIEAVILTLDREERKMSLGLKQLMPDPWGQISTKYPVGSKHNAKVRNFTNFGVFVELEEGIDGLIHISDLSWSKKIKHPSEFTKIGEEIEVLVLEVDAENRRLSLGHKQIEDNPWESYETIFKVDSLHEGIVGKVTDKGAVVTLPYGVEGFAPYRHLLRENGATAKTDEKIEVKVIEFSKENRKIIVSHTRTYEDAKNVAKSETAEKAEDSTSKSIKKVKENVEKSTLGDLGVLSALRSELETSEKKTKDTIVDASSEEVAKKPKKAKVAKEKESEESETESPE
jgi:small subunit ribosomal protein S1